MFSKDPLSNPEIKKIELNSQPAFLFMTGRDLTIEEVSLILPSGYDFEKTELDLPAFTRLQNFGIFTEKESLFFIKMCQTGDLHEKEIYQNLLSILKEDRRKKKKAIKKLSKITNYNLVIEKIILLLISQELNHKCKERLICIIEVIYTTNCADFIYWLEVFILMVKYLDNVDLRMVSLNLISHIFNYDLEKITKFVLQEINSDDEFIQNILSRILALFVIFQGYSEALRIFINAKQGNLLFSNANQGNLLFSNAKQGNLIFLKAHFYILAFLKKEISEFKSNMLNFLLLTLRNGQRKLRKETANVISHLCLSGMLNNEDCSIFYKEFLRIFLEYCNFRNPFYMENPFFKGNHFSLENLTIPSLDQEKSYLMHILRCCSILSTNNQDFSEMTFTILKKWGDFTINNVKIFYRICENLEYFSAIEYCVENIEEFLNPKFQDYKNMVISIFEIFLPNEDLEKILISKMTHKEIILEIFSKTDAMKIENKEIYQENLYSLIKSNKEFCIQNVIHLGTIGGFSGLDWYSIFNLGKSKIDEVKEEIFSLGFKLINKVLYKIEKKDLKKFGEILFEKLSKSNLRLLSCQLNTLSKIYNIVPFNNITDLILDIAPLLKIKDDLVKEKGILFISEILKNEDDHNIKKTEFMRIAYDVMDYLSFWYVKKKQCAIDLLIQISDLVPPQELINIFIDFLEFDDKNIKKGVISAISQLANYVGLFNVLPVLLVDYKYANDKVKLIILRTITKCNVSKMYIPYLIPVIEDAILCPNIEFRISGIELITGVLANIDEFDTKIFTHFLNITWFNILDKNILLKKAFNKFIEEFTKAFGSQFLIKYTIQGLFHPSKIVKKRYFEIFNIISENDENTGEYLSILNAELQS